MAGGAEGSAVGRVWREARTGAASGWRATSPEARRQFFATLVVALLVAAAASAAGSLAIRAAGGAGPLPGDAAVTAWIESLISVHTALWLGAFTSSAMVIPVLAAAAVLAARAGRWDRATLAVATFAASKAIILAGWLTWSRPRPGGVADGAIIPGDMGSFPSGHSVQAWTVYGLLALWWARASGRGWEKALAWGAVVAGSLVVGAARVRIGAHHPSDILGGILLGAVWLIGMARAERATEGGLREPE